MLSPPVAAQPLSIRRTASCPRCSGLCPLAAPNGGAGAESNDSGESSSCHLSAISKLTVVSPSQIDRWETLAPVDQDAAACVRLCSED